MDNAGTLAQLVLIARFGSAWFRRTGTEPEPGTTMVTIGGAIGRPGVVGVAGGIPLRIILAAAGWVPTRHPGKAWALIGGLTGR